MIKLISRTVDNSVPIESYPAEAGGFERGQALKLSAGKLCVATSADAIEFISEETKSVATGEMLKVTRVVADGTYESELASDVDSINPGDVFAISDSCVGAQEASGHLKVLFAEGKSAGSKVRFNII